MKVYVVVTTDGEVFGVYEDPVDAALTRDRISGGEIYERDVLLTKQKEKW